MSVDPRRLAHEMQALARMGRGTLYRKPNGKADAWESYFCQFGFRGYVVTITLSPNHPFDKPVITITPNPGGGHYGSSLCYAASGEWRPEFTAATAAAKACHYLALAIARRI